ncbi:FAD-binding oxidoreductase [Aquincola sp. S2]|uniref:FAD-binding oxidoreductase n=1 Tax=Pseudaquabacterium terrae TaxID=2732868 RepID=A0ABX2EFL6_9BURK|nr:FAD-binding oxidoreductase [Aquabacterium terrae]NRF67424.1 FAD-binding oxidoreductase [Aquabacterium terrae]
MKVLIIGGGAVGSAVALFLKLQGGSNVDVTVIEPDPGLAQASSALSAGSIRQQFSNAINVRMSQFGHEVIANAQAWLGVDDEPVELGFVPSGYLFLATGATAVLEANHAVQRDLGAPVRLLDRAALQQRFHWLNSDDVQLASLGEAGEGWFDGYAFARALARKARSLGARWHKARVDGLERAGDRLVAARLADGTRLEADAFVNAAGPWARGVAQLAGIHLPVHARRRTVFAFSCPTALPCTPLVIDPSGCWFRSEGHGFIGAWTPGEYDDDPDDLPLDQPDVAQFEDRLWPALAHRVPAFEALRMTRAWAGYYEVHPLDHNAIIGPHPELTNLLFANGFSGHGLQHAPAVGRGIAEWLLEGGWRSLDLSPFAYERLAEGHAFAELAVI